MPDADDLWIKARWDAIRYRCYDPTSAHYHRYGGRGIRLSDEFLDPRVFVAYAKSLPDARPEMQLDRIDNSRGYERGNLRWVTAKVNCNNRETSVHITHNGVEMPIGEFAAKYTTLSRGHVRELYHAGKTSDEIVNWERSGIFVTYAGDTMSLRQFAVRHAGHLTYQTVRRLYHDGVSLDAIAGWVKRKPAGVTYKGEWMSLRQFALRHTGLSAGFVGKLYRRGVSLDDIVNWRKKYETVSYHGVDMPFGDFVKNHTGISYSYARALYRAGKSLDEIAHWGETCTSL